MFIPENPLIISFKNLTLLFFFDIVLKILSLITEYQDFAQIWKTYRGCVQRRLFVLHQHFSLKEINKKYINAPSYGLKLKSKAKIPLFFCKPLPGSYSGSPEISTLPFIIENTFGKGKSIYIAGTFGGSLYKYHFPEYYQVLSNLACEFSEPFVRLENAPSSIEVNVRKKENSVFIYLINFTSEMKRPIQRIISCLNIKIDILLTEKVKSLRALCLEKKLEFTNKGNSISFVLPVIEDYEVLEIEL